MKSLGSAPDEDDMSQINELEKTAPCLGRSQEPIHPKRKLALAAVLNTRNGREHELAEQILEEGVTND